MACFFIYGIAFLVYLRELYAFTLWHTARPPRPFTKRTTSIVGFINCFFCCFLIFSYLIMFVLWGFFSSSSIIIAVRKNLPLVLEQ